MTVRQRGATFGLSGFIKWGENVSESSLYVTYCVKPQKTGLRRMESIHSHSKSLFPTSPGEMSESSPTSTQLSKATQEFLSAKGGQAVIVGAFIEAMENRRNAKWPQLQKALDTCKQKGATLLITELGTLASHESFTQTLLASTVNFHCIDQPFVNQTILEALSKHAEVQRKLHGKLIREGLKMTSAKSGNPNAAEVISKVNKPKIDTAIVFACLLQPIIQDYRRKGYSQRQMVKTLNEEGFTAPEGGKWVLSQLQKVLDRVRLNEIATELTTLLKREQAEKRSEAEIASLLNEKSCAPLKQLPWDETQVKKLQDRIEQIKDITTINRFVLDLLPVLREYRKRQYSPTDMLMSLQQAGMPIRQPSVTA